MKMVQITVFVLILIIHSISSKALKFQCKEDGYFRDPMDCSRFITCANGIGSKTTCPVGLLYNFESHSCDWPENVNCDVDLEKFKSRKLSEPIYIYLTFDDGPNEGTGPILDVLKQHGVKATFFVNSENLFPYYRSNDGERRLKPEELYRLVERISEEGHVLGDHSFDHMNHNTLSGPKNAYLSLKDDMKFFGKMNFEPIQHLTKEDYHEFINFTMSHYVRQPYTNNWRVPPVKKDQKAVFSDCPSCTIPQSSGQIAMELADELYRNGKVVVGWDTEWSMNFDTNRYKYGGLQMFTRLINIRTKRPRQIVILAHDRGFRDGAQELSAFLQLAKQSGYVFRTIENYVFDDPFTNL